MNNNNLDKNKIFMIVGPTASGKTDAAINVANTLNPNAEIISADSVQIYKKLNIGAAKPTVQEMQNIKHYLLDEIELDAPRYSVAEFQQSAFLAIDEIHAKNKNALIVGGTGLYINSLIFPMEFTSAKSDDDFRKEMQILEENKAGSAHEKLIIIDKQASEKIHPNDTKRVIRALEVFHTTGKTITEHNFKNSQKKPKYLAKIVGLTMPRELIYSRINQRVDLMIKAGLVQEVEDILAQKYDPDLNSLQGLGYKEIIQALQNKITIEEAIEKIKLETRHFAKRQYTWFLRNKNITWIDATQEKNIIVEQICEVFEK